jgi:23S rRNA (cytosine1962-C5)-methyltransferase
VSASIQIRLKDKRDRPTRLGHPWIFSGAVADWSGSREAGAVADVFDSKGEWLARGLAHPASGLAVRVVTRDQAQAIDDALFGSRIDAAIELRSRCFATPGETDAYRLVFSESDGLSGLIADRYADLVSIRVSARGLLPFLPAMLGRLRERAGVSRLFVAPEKDAESREGFGVAELDGLSDGGPSSVEIRESGHRFLIDAAAGQKTGFYLDQRENRRRVAAYARGRSVLSCYCYTGAFEVYAAAAGASSITGIDDSGQALEGARRHLALNGCHAPAEYLEADVPQALRRFRDSRRSFDLIVLDPPRFVLNPAQKEKGLRAYKDINLLALKLLTPGGILATFSCSGLITPDDLRTAVRWAAQDAGRQVRILETLGQPPDHPRLITFPESEYLTGLIAHCG